MQLMQRLRIERGEPLAVDGEQTLQMGGVVGIQRHVQLHRLDQTQRIEGGRHRLARVHAVANATQHADDVFPDTGYDRPAAETLLRPRRG